MRFACFVQIRLDLVYTTQHTSSQPVETQVCAVAQVVHVLEDFFGGLRVMPDGEVHALEQSEPPRHRHLLSGTLDLVEQACTATLKQARHAAAQIDELVKVAARVIGGEIEFPVAWPDFAPRGGLRLDLVLQEVPRFLLTAVGQLARLKQLIWLLVEHVR